MEGIIHKLPIGTLRVTCSDPRLPNHDEKSRRSAEIFSLTSDGWEIKSRIERVWVLGTAPPGLGMLLY